MDPDPPKADRMTISLLVSFSPSPIKAFEPEGKKELKSMEDKIKEDAHERALLSEFTDPGSPAWKIENIGVMVNLDC